MAGKQRVVVIGWDSAPPGLVFEELRSAMPVTAALLGQSLWGRLRSTDPPITVPAWTTIFSSVNPGGLGFFGFRNLRRGTYDGKWIATSEAVRVDRVWDIASRHGRRCCALNVPQTYPPTPLNGLMVSCFLTPDNSVQYTYPPALKGEIEEISGGYMLDVEGFRTEDKARLLSDLYRMTDGHFAVAREMLRRERWDLFIYVEMGPDRLHHGFWRYFDPSHRRHEAGNPYVSVARDYYAHLDAQLGELLELAGDDAAVILVSDHGAKRMDGSFNLNDWLICEGLLVLKDKPGGACELRPQMVDWPRTTAWAWGGYYARIFINVKGREPEGKVEPDRYEAVRADLIARLESLTDDQGRQMATRALRPEEIFSGPHVKDAPDLLVYLDDLNWRAGQDVGHDGLYSFETEIGPDDAVHDYDGIIVVHEAGQTSAGLIEGARAADVAPTILDLMGLPIPQGFEGRSLLG